MHPFLFIRLIFQCVLFPHSIWLTYSCGRTPRVLCASRQVHTGVMKLLMARHKEAAHNLAAGRALESAGPVG